MKTRHAPYLALAFMLGISRSIAADQPAKVTEVFNEVHHGATESTATTRATVGTAVHDGEYLETGGKSRAALQLPTASLTRLGANTIFNYSVESNTVDLQAGTILFCKRKDAPRQLNIKTEAVMAGITGTTGFIHIHTDATTHRTTTTFGLVEGHAIATANGQSFPIGAGEILEFTPGSKPFVFAFDVPRFVKSSPLLTKFKGRLSNQSYIDAEVESYQDDVRRGFIQPPSHAIDYTGEIPVLSTPAYDSAMNAQGQPKGTAGNPTVGKPSFPSNSGPGY